MTLAVETPVLSPEAAQAAALRTYKVGLFRKRCDAEVHRCHLAYIPFWVGHGTLRSKGIFRDNVSIRLFACDGWKGTSGAVQGALPTFRECQEDDLPGLVKCRVSRDDAEEHIAKQASRFAQGRVLTAAIENLRLDLIYKPFWAVLVVFKDGRRSWQLVSADEGVTTYRFHGEIEAMLETAGILSSSTDALAVRPC